MNFLTDLTKIGIILCGLSYLTECGCRPVKRRAVSELQLMHNYGEFIHSSQRQEWLQMKLQDMYSASVSTPQESTPKIADHRPPKPQKHKMEENKPKTAPQKTLHRHSTKDNTLKPGIQ
ncbi:hypothetical protein XENTR_v10010638 [Xenopus tropicalis]|nr:hypothetical protein XENTR_v10010638 [Xenopus tropicalis]|eukprot:XP_002936789.2 PREDICTED: parathyroid hormone [Xenopus tropicalis]